jgi:UDP-glucose 4-epimerase
MESWKSYPTPGRIHASRNPYGENKLEIEQLLAAETRTDPDFRFAALRYFNPIGAHPSGRIGEDPRGIPDNLFPYITQVAIGKLPRLRVFGNDYPTPDGTGVRDYLHVMDLVAGHLSALRYLKKETVDYAISEPVRNSVFGSCAHSSARPGDSATRSPRRPAALRPTCDPSLAARELGWRAELRLEDMCRDSWRWQSMNPAGYP